ncbi:MAG: hypothetical protein M3373_07980 [Gemmatimonadota bacterium]|nr:hypothetical protein [Gemmatimonadota bacterium]
MNFPLDLRFKLIAIAQQIAVRDASGRLLYYARQKAFKLKEAVTVFADEAQSQPLYRIAADRILDISAQYHIETQDGTPLGYVQRRGMRSIWRAHYEIHRDGRQILSINEENPWVKLADGMASGIPIVGMFTGYLLHPAYSVTQVSDGARILRLIKQPAFFEGRYRIERIAERPTDVEELAVLGLVMMVLLERDRG